MPIFAKGEKKLPKWQNYTYKEVNIDKSEYLFG